ncbi:MAG TPA: pitrilysin family protein [Pseudonocardiaceae bacterium]|jgi:predicted Zn-dependent peptidase|nr:pitrilysin family protein [Pseudonocardiaceae bacterium]
MTVTSHRSAAEIGRTDLGPRPLPELSEQRVADYPAIADTVIGNGLRVVAVRRTSVPLVELRLRIPFGGNEPTRPATAELLTSALLTGTERRDRVQLDTDLALVGGELHASVDPERLVISGGCLASGLTELIDVLADVITSPAYATDEVIRERDRLVERITVAMAQPGVIARKALQRRRYGDHPFVNEMPAADDVALVDELAVRAMHQGSVVPRGSALVLVGDFDPDEAVAAVERGLGSVWASETRAVEMAPLPMVTGGDLLLVHRAGAVQSQFRLSAQAVPRTDPRYPALQLANLAFGGYFSSRLVENIREDKGYTYHARSSLEFTGSGATLLVDTDTASEVSAAALLELRYELAKLAVLPPTEAEVESVRQYAIGTLLTSTASQSGFASQMAALIGVGLDAEWFRGHPARLAAVTTEQVAEAALEFFAPTAFTGVIIGDADLLGRKLGALGGVELP